MLVFGRWLPCECFCPILYLFCKSITHWMYSTQQHPQMNSCIILCTVTHSAQDNRPIIAHSCRLTALLLTFKCMASGLLSFHVQGVLQVNMVCCPLPLLALEDNLTWQLCHLWLCCVSIHTQWCEKVFPSSCSPEPQVWNMCLKLFNKCQY